ncbi:UDP-2,3-diacylglucosamine hydrolase, partial [Salmonella enterica subsp. enterica serovar Typhimurium]
FAGRRWLLSHGDALCLQDVEYQHFRALARNPQWQAQLLARPLAERRAQGRSARSESEARKQAGTAPYADVDAAAAVRWLRA